jgi:hypothetical protein
MRITILLFVLLPFIAFAQLPVTKDQNIFYPVYTFSAEIIGLTLEVNCAFPQDKYVDSVFRKLQLADTINKVMKGGKNISELVDDKARLKFYINKKIENLFLPKFTSPLYVYCQKGMVRRAVLNVFFSVDDCLSNVVVFTFQKIDSSIYGRPLMCSTDYVDLTYKNQINIDEEINRIDKVMHADYKDSLQYVSFGETDSLFFSYRDDFNWNHSGEIRNYFPARIICKRNNEGKLQTVWKSDLDLFGIPCD